MLAVAMNVEPVRRNEIRAASALLTTAFLDNPGVRGLIPIDDVARRSRILERGMRGFLWAGFHSGSVETLRHEGQLGTVAVTFAPGAYPFSPGTELRAAFGPLTAGPSIGLRYVRFDGYLKKGHLEGPHHYLQILGTHPDYQGRGYGSRMLEHLNARADGLPWHLETDRESSVRLYQRNGYEIADDADTGFGFRMWRMTRPA